MVVFLLVLNSLATLTDTDINTPADGQVLTYDNSSQKWINANQAAGGGSKIVLTTSELSLIGQTATLTDGVTTLSAEIDNSGKATFEGVTMTGNLTASASDGVNTATASLTVPYFGNYTAALSFFSATVTVTFPYSNGATCTITDGDTTLSADGSPMAFSIPNTGTWTATCTLDGIAKTQNFVITTDGQTESHTFSYGTINLTYSNEFRGISLTCTDGNTTITKTAPSAGNTMSFYPPNTGTWTISGIYSGVTYSSGSITVSSLSTPVSATIQTLVSITVTIYGAKQDTITFTDAAGTAHTVTFASGATSKSETLKVKPTGSNITFTSSVSKNPSNLSQNYSKTISLTTSTTSVYVMPASGTNMLYWYGYVGSDTEFTTSANGWANSSFGKAPEGLTVNTRNLYGTTTDGQWYRGFASKTSRTYTNKTVHLIGTTTETGSTPAAYYPYVGILSSKSGGSITSDMPIKSIFTSQHKTGTLNGTGYLTACTNCSYVTTITVEALWVE